MASSPYNPATYWNARALECADNPVRAGCLDDPDENRCIDRIQRPLLRAAMRQLERGTQLRGKSVLDYGCGSGRWVTFLRQYGMEYHGVDIAEEMLALARRSHPDAELRRLDAAGLPYPEQCFDVVSSIAVLHHNPYEAQERMVADMVRVLRPGGSAIWLEGQGPHSMSRTKYFPRPLPEWIELAAHNGLTLTWHRGARYLVLRPLMTLMSRSGRGQRPRRLSPWQRLLTRIDATIDPYLSAATATAGSYTRAVMLLSRSI